MSGGQHATDTWAVEAYRQGYKNPDDPCPYRKGTASAGNWQRGRQDRLMGREAKP